MDVDLFTYRFGMSFYTDHYIRLRPVLFDLMTHGIRWDRESANEKAKALEERRRDILGSLRASHGDRLLSTERHRSRLYAKLLEEQRELKCLGKVERAQARGRLKELAAESKNIRQAGLQTETIVKGLSDDKIKKYFYTTEKVPVIRARRKTKGTSTPTANDTALIRIGADHPKYKELIELILEYRRCQKLVSTYLDPNKVSDDGRIHSTFKPHGTQSGRLASSADPLEKGFNAQNPDGELKYLFIPDPD